MCHVLQNSYSQGRTGVQVVLLLPMALPSLRAPMPKAHGMRVGPRGRAVRARSSLTHSHCVSIVLSQNCHQPIPLHPVCAWCLCLGPQVSWLARSFSCPSCVRLSEPSAWFEVGARNQKTVAKRFTRDPPPHFSQSPAHNGRNEIVSR